MSWSNSRIAVPMDILKLSSAPLARAGDTVLVKGVFICEWSGLGVLLPWGGPCCDVATALSSFVVGGCMGLRVVKVECWLLPLLPAAAAAAAAAGCISCCPTCCCWPKCCCPKCCWCAYCCWPKCCCCANCCWPNCCCCCCPSWWPNCWCCVFCAALSWNCVTMARFFIMNWLKSAGSISKSIPSSRLT